MVLRKVLDVDICTDVQYNERYDDEQHVLSLNLSLDTEIG